MIGPRSAALAALVLLAACARTPKPEPIAPPPAVATPAPASAADAGARRIATPPLRAGPEALAAFRASCPALLRREDASGLTEPGDWAAPCAAAATATDAARFFAEQLTAVAVGDGRGLDTGYYEPELAGSRTAAPGYAAPLYRRPPDLVEVDLGAFSTALKGKRIRGRVEGGALVPYWDRAAIDRGALAGKGLEIAWAADPYEAFFLQIQGSGRLRLPDGSVLRLGYDGQNGRDYVAIGKLLRERGAIAPPVTMEAILAWLRAHPAEAPAVLEANPSYVFFRELTGDGPVGALGVALTPRVSAAVDPRFVPLGAPLWIETVTADGPLAALLVAQDTGGAIKGANRVDIFFGAGDDARRLAGSQSATGGLVLLLPPAAAARLGAR